MIFLLTLVFIILTIAFVQEVQGVHLTLPYLTATLVFYLSTDPVFVELFTRLPLLSKIERFECRESIYGKLCLKILASILGLTIHASLWIKTKRMKLFLFGTYVNVYLRIKNILWNEVTILAQEDQAIKTFRTASKKDLLDFDDVCAICLGDMKLARVTKCHHIFHDHCLSLAVQSSTQCPTCKTLLT